GRPGGQGPNPRPGRGGQHSRRPNVIGSPTWWEEISMKILVVDIGGTNVKMLASGHENPRKFPSGPELTPQQIVSGVLAATKDWEYEAVSIGFPGPVLCGQPMTEPVNLGPGWMGFDFAAAFHRPVKVINDAAMQALGSYQGGKMLFLGLGTGFGA